MTALKRPPIFRDTTETYEKIRLFERLSPSALHLVFDFDRTLTIAQPDADDNVTTWSILSQHLPPDAQQEYSELFRYYRPIEKSGRMTDQQAVVWWSSILDVFVRHNLDMTEVGKDFLTKASIRPGTQEIFAFCDQHALPTVILSAGVSNVIQLWMDHYQITPSAIVSTELLLDAYQRVIGWNRNTLVHALNKHEIKHPEVDRIRTERTHTILVGDGLNDTTMADGVETVFRVYINDSGHEIDTIRHTVFGEYNFDCIISGEDLSYIVNMLKNIGGQ